MGVLPHQLADMPERDFQELRANAPLLMPFRRLEAMLARMTAEIASGRGVKDVSPADFMLRMQETDAPPVTTEVMREMVGFKARGKKRKKVH